MWQNIRTQQRLSLAHPRKISGPNPLSHKQQILFANTFCDLNDNLANCAWVLLTSNNLTRWDPTMTIWSGKGMVGRISAVISHLISIDWIYCSIGFVVSNRLMISFISISWCLVYASLSSRELVLSKSPLSIVRVWRLYIPHSYMYT